MLVFKEGFAPVPGGCGPMFTVERHCFLRTEKIILAVFQNVLHRFGTHGNTASDSIVYIPMTNDTEHMEVADVQGEAKYDHVTEGSPMNDHESDESADDEHDSPRAKPMRSRKSVERFRGPPSVASPAKAPSKRNDAGAGVKLGEISVIADKLYKVPVKDDALKRLHRVLYGSDGTATTRKKEIRQWRGASGDAAKTSMSNALAGAKSVAMLKDICSILSLGVSGDRSTLESRILDFLLHPTGSTDAAPKKLKKKKRSSEKKASRAAKKAKKATTTTSAAATSSFSRFLKQRMPEVLHQAGGSLSARDVTELLTLEWKHMSASDKAAFAPPPASAVKAQPVKKVISKTDSPKKQHKAETSDNDSGSSSDSSSSSSGSSSSDSDSSSGNEGGDDNE